MPDTKDEVRYEQHFCTSLKAYVNPFSVRLIDTLDLLLRNRWRLFVGCKNDSSSSKQLSKVRLSWVVETSVWAKESCTN